MCVANILEEVPIGVKGDITMKGNKEMTAEQFAELMGVTVEYLSKYNARVIAKAEKEKGLVIRKEGRGKKARYILESMEQITSIFEKENFEFEMNKEFIKFKDYKFKAMLALAMKPDTTFFEGTLKEFARQIGENLEEVNESKNEKTNRNIALRIEAALEELQKEGVIVVYNDPKQKSKEKVLVIFIRPSAKEELIPINTDGMIHAKELCDKKRVNMRWENFLKVWLALKVFREDEIKEFTIANIEKMTGLSSGTIKTAISFMREEEMLDIKKNKCYIRELKTVYNKGLKTGNHNFDFNIL